ncbi:hypothetical protein MMC11_002141 [Xylographa trunciseda]|nr:hypothetical protein [Xylographa trunciseda]
MSPIVSVKEPGPAPRRARKRQRRRGANSTEEKVNLDSSIERLGRRPEVRAIPEDDVTTSNRFAALMSPATNTAPRALDMEKEPKTGSASRASKQLNKNDLILGPPRSAFTFSCSRSASTTANVHNYAGSQRHTLVRVSAAGSPKQKVPTSSLGLSGDSKILSEGSSIRSEVLPDKPSSSIETVKPAIESDTFNEVSHTQAQPPNSMATHDFAAAYTSTADTEIPTGWPKPEPLIIAPATKDRKSRFLPTLSQMVTSDSKSSTRRNETAIGETATEMVTSPESYANSLEHQVPIPTVASKHVSSHGSADSGYGTKSGSPSTEVSPTWNHSPGSDQEWEGRDVGFWIKD